MVFYSEDHRAAVKAVDDRFAELGTETIPMPDIIQIAIDAAERNRHDREVEAKQPLLRIEQASYHRNARANKIDELTVKQGRQVLEQIANERKEMRARRTVLSDIESSLNKSLGYTPPPTPDDDDDDIEPEEDEQAEDRTGWNL